MSAWTTADELYFIDWMGTGSHASPGSHVSTAQPPADVRLKLLLGYQKGISMRTEWGSLDRPKIEKHVATLIRNLSTT